MMNISGIFDYICAALTRAKQRSFGPKWRRDAKRAGTYFKEGRATTPFSPTIIETQIGRLAVRNDRVFRDGRTKLSRKLRQRIRSLTACHANSASR